MRAAQTPGQQRAAKNAGPAGPARPAGRAAPRPGSARSAGPGGRYASGPVWRRGRRPCRHAAREGRGAGRAEARYRARPAPSTDSATGERAQPRQGLRAAQPPQAAPEAALPGRAREQRQAGAALMAAGHERERGRRRRPARHRCEASAASGAGARPAARRVGVERPQARRGVAPAKQAQGPAIPAASSAPRATCGARADGGIAPSSAGCVVAVRAPQGGRARLPCIPARDRSRSGCRRIAAGAPQASCSQGQHCPYHRRGPRKRVVLNGRAPRVCIT